MANFRKVLLLILCLGLFVVGCDDTPEPVYHYKVHRENPDGGHTLWVTQSRPEMDEGFLCWKRKNSTEICISGKITLESFKVGVK